MFGGEFPLWLCLMSHCLNWSTGTTGLHQLRDLSKPENSLWHQMLQGNVQDL